MGKDDCGAIAAAVLRYAQRRRYRPGQQLWAEGQPAHELVFVERGRLTVRQGMQQLSARNPVTEQQQQQRATRVFEFGPGCIAAAVDFYLNRPRSSSATVSGGNGNGGSGSSGTCQVLVLTREALGRMAAEAPAALHVLQAVTLRAKCLDLGAAAELALEQASMQP